MLPPDVDPHYRAAGIQALDPLTADPLLDRLPAMNSGGDLRALHELLREMSPRAADRLTEHTPGRAESLAIMRDLGIVLGSVKRHGVEPLSIVPELAPALLALGWRTDLVPRDTVQHYTVWNPSGTRRRRYTDDPQEATLQGAVTQVFPALSGSLSLSSALADLDPRDVRFAPLMVALGAMTQTMVTTIDEVVDQVSPVFFAQTLRPYFEEVEVAGVRYLGPAAAQVPLWLVDVTLWASDRDDTCYRAFIADSLPYALPSWRRFFRDHHALPSAVSRVRSALVNDPDDADLQRSALATGDLLRTLKVFRARHLGIARRAYADDIALYENGSGGAPVALLRAILDLTRENESLVGRSGRRSRERDAVRRSPGASR